MMKELSREFDEINPIRKKEFLDNIRQPRTSAKEFLVNQIFFIRKGTWVLTFTLTVVAIMAISIFGLNLIGNSLWNVGAISPFLALTMLMEITKSDSNKMVEMEDSCLYNRHQVVLARLIILGGTNFTSICLIALAIKLSAGQNIIQILLWLILPYMLTCVTSLYILKGSKRRESSMYCSIVAGGVAVSYSIISNLYRVIFELKYITLLSIIAITLIILTIIMFRRYINIKEEDNDTYYRQT